MHKISWNKIIRFLYWSLASFFMFTAAVTVISILKPGPTEVQVMSFMQGMMSAMHNSLMGASMDNSEMYSFLLQESARLSVITILLGILIGVPLRLWKNYD